MKKYFTIFLLTLLLASCNKIEDTEVVTNSGEIQKQETIKTGESVEISEYPQITQESSVNIKDIIEKIKSNLEGKYTILNYNINYELKINELGIELYEQSPVYKIEGYDFYISYNGGDSLRIKSYNENLPYPQPNDIILRKEIATIYKDFGLSKVETIGGKDNGDETDIYSGNGIICSIDTLRSENNYNTASCGHIDKYKEEGERIKPLADVIGISPGTTVLRNLQINDSPVVGYQKASISVGDTNSPGGAVVLFYKKESSPWIYFKGTQEPLLCSDYNTADLKNAFKGDSCYGSDGQIMSTVQ